MPKPNANPPSTIHYRVEQRLCQIGPDDHVALDADGAKDADVPPAVHYVDVDHDEHDDAGNHQADSADEIGDHVEARDHASHSAPILSQLRTSAATPVARISSMVMPAAAGSRVFTRS